MASEPDWRRLLAAGEGLPLVLVGGHAALSWADVYGIPHAATTSDLDWLTTERRAARLYADRLGPDATLRESSDGGFHLALVRVKDDDGTTHTVDFISGVHGVAREDQLEKRAVELDIGGTKLRVLHPVHVLCSKVANLGLPERVYKLARTPAARDARARHGIDPYAAIAPWPSMDIDFRERTYPRRRERLDAAHALHLVRTST